jgi:hypothetical protein
MTDHTAPDLVGEIVAEFGREETHWDKKPMVVVSAEELADWIAARFGQRAVSREEIEKVFLDSRSRFLATSDHSYSGIFLELLLDKIGLDAVHALLLPAPCGSQSAESETQKPLSSMREPWVAQVREALAGLLDCISETRGKNAFHAVERARQALAAMPKQ